jgi:hypothetical protein
MRVGIVGWEEEDGGSRPGFMVWATGPQQLGVARGRLTMGPTRQPLVTADDGESDPVGTTRLDGVHGAKWIRTHAHVWVF